MSSTPFDPSETPQASQSAKSVLRETLKAARQALEPARAQQLNHQLCVHLLRLVGDSDWLKIAAFHAFRGEPDLSAGLDALAGAGRQLFLPKVGERGEMTFHRWAPGCVMTPNRFGIPEPVTDEVVRPEQLDLVLMPLVAYSPNGSRLGMGAGFYDRAFAFRPALGLSTPRLVGVAYRFQQVDGLPSDPWDVPMDGCLTESGYEAFGPRSRGAW